MGRLTQSLAMGVGASGAMTDVSSYVDLEAGVSRSWGRKSEFDDAAPGTFSFTLDNADGRFTPGNTASALATTVTEGMQVCWKLDDGAGHTRLVAGTIQGIEPVFPSAESAWAQVRITCDDMLGNAGRRELKDLTTATFESSRGFLRWPLSEDAGSSFGLETNVGAQPLVPTGAVTFGATSQIPTTDTVALLPAGSSLRNYALPVVPYGTTTTMGSWGFWFQVSASTDFQALFYFFNGSGPFGPTTIDLTSGTLSLTPGLIGTPIAGPTIAVGTPYYVAFSSATTFAAGVWTVAQTLWVNGVAYGPSNFNSGVSITSLTDAQRTPRFFRFSTSGSGNVYLSHVSHTLNVMSEYPIQETNAETRIAALATVVPEITLDTVPTMASTILAYPEVDGQSALDALNDVIRAEQGSIYTVTTGTLTSPTQKVATKARNRGTTVSYTFDVEDEASGTTDFIRDLTNMVSSCTAQSGDVSATYTDSTLTTRVGSANTTETVPYRDRGDLFNWATDRVWRGSNVALRPPSITIDAFTTPSNRAADLIAILPGERVQLTGLPSTQIGFSTWDGWFLGADEEHTLTSHEFKLYFAPTTPTTGIFDTDRFMAGGELSLSAGINSSVTSISVATIGSTFTTSGSDLPLTITIDSEQMSVTACTSATPQVMTVTRGANGTTAASHSSGALVELTTQALFAY